MNAWLLAASLLALGCWGIHTFVGERTVARPLVAASDLGAVPKWTQFYCWHLVTITLAVMAFGLGYAAFVPSALDVALLIAALATAFGLFGLALPRRVGRTYGEMPQGFLLLPIGLLALVGALA